MIKRTILVIIATLTMSGFNLFANEIIVVQVGDKTQFNLTFKQVALSGFLTEKLKASGNSIIMDDVGYSEFKKVYACINLVKHLVDLYAQQKHNSQSPLLSSQTAAKNQERQNVIRELQQEPSHLDKVALIAKTWRITLLEELVREAKKK